MFSALRGARWPPKYKALKRAFVEKTINPKTGRLASFYQCAACAEKFTAKEVQVDHIEPVVPTTGFVSWDDTINRLYCNVDNLQVLCRPCHKAKSLSERKK